MKHINLERLSRAIEETRAQVRRKPARNEVVAIRLTSVEKNLLLAVAEREGLPHTVLAANIVVEVLGADHVKPQP